MSPTKPDETLDLVGVACPQNSARALLKLEGMKFGSILEIIIDDGEPIKNVPLSIKEEGHKIIDTRREGDKWILLVRKL